MATKKEAVITALVMHGNEWTRIPGKTEGFEWTAGNGRHFVIVWTKGEWALSRNHSHKRGHPAKLGTYKTAMVAARVAAMNAKSRMAR